MYNIGDMVSYPMHGAGVIENIEEKLILNQSKHYYVLRFSDGQMRVLIPTENAISVGLRNIIKENEAEAVISLLGSSSESDDTLSWNKRFRENQDKLKTGDIFEVATVVKTLLKRMNEKGLSSGEKRMMNQSLQILVSELSLCLKLDPLMLRDQIVNSKIAVNN